jgi:nucleoside-diphosphate-sugar epimerase
MKILVAGATGAVGRILLPKLVSAGHEVTGLTHADSRKQAIATMGARAEAVDVFDRSGMMDVFADVRPEIVIHQLTALHDRDFAANARIRVEGTRNLVDAAVSAGVQRVIAQSIA